MSPSVALIQTGFYVADPLHPGEYVPLWDPKYGGIVNYTSLTRQYKVSDAAALQRWQGAIHDYQTNATHEVNDLHLHTAAEYLKVYPPPAIPLQTTVTLGNDYAVHVTGGNPLAVMPDPLIPSDTGVPSTGVLIPGMGPMSGLQGIVQAIMKLPPDQLAMLLGLLKALNAQG